MATFSGKNLKGSFGNITFAKLGDVSIIKSKIENIKQTPATKKAASVFGTYISPFAKHIRWAFESLINGYSDRPMVNRMNSDVSTILYQHIDPDGKFHFTENSFDRLLNFNFNLSSPLNKSLLAKPIITFTSGQAKITWPEFSVTKNLRFPVKANCCIIDFRCAQFCLNKGKWKVHDSDKIEIKKDQIFTASQTFTYKMPEGSLFLFGIGITYLAGTQRVKVNHKTFNPAGICAVGFAPGTCSDAEVKGWMPLPFTLL